MDNIFFMRDILDVCRLFNVDVGIVSLDQEKAFDRVDHSYLFSALRAFGFGDGFLAWTLHGPYRADAFLQLCAAGMAGF